MTSRGRGTRGRGSGLVPSRRAPGRAAPLTSVSSRVQQEDQFLDESTAIRGEDDQQLDEGKATIEVTSLPTDGSVSLEELQNYFEDQGAQGNISVQSKTMLGRGRARLELCGLTTDEMIEIQTKMHSIKGRKISVKLQSPLDFPPTPLKLPPLSDQADTGESETECDTLEVSDLPPRADEDTLKVYFEGRRSGGCDGSVLNCTFISPRVARVKFTSPKVTAKILSKTEHEILRSPVRLQYASPPKQDTSLKSEGRLVIPELSNEIGLDLLEVFLEGRMNMQVKEDFTLEEAGTSVVISFSDHKSPTELLKLINEIGSARVKGLHIQAEIYKAPSCIRVQNIDAKHYNDEFISYYFESPRSRGGKVQDVQLLENGEAIVTFEDPTVLDNVLEIRHTKLGANVNVERSLTAPKPSNKLTQQSPSAATIPSTAVSSTSSITTQPFEIVVDPFTAKSLEKCPQELQKCAKEKQVQVTVDAVKGVIRVTPGMQFTQPGWQQNCIEHITAFIASTNMKMKVDIPSQAASEIWPFLVHTSQREPSFIFELSPDNTTATVVGESNVVKTFKAKVEDICSSYIQAQKQVLLNAKEYAFIIQVMQKQITDEYPGVCIQFSPTDSSLLLEGSTRDVEKLKTFLTSHALHISIPLQLHPVLVQFLATEVGSNKLKKLLEKRSAAVYFEQVSQSDPKLYILCGKVRTEPVEAVVASIQAAFVANTDQFPPRFVSILPELQEEYRQLCEELQKQHHVLIVTANQEVVVAGLSTDVVHSKQTLHDFIADKSIPPKPLLIPVDPLIAESLQKSSEGLQSSAHALRVQVEVNAKQGAIQVTPIGYPKPHWQQQCQQTITSFVHSSHTKVEIKIPKEAAAEIMKVLVSQQQDPTVVLVYHDNFSAATAAGNVSAMKTLQAEIEGIYSTFVNTQEQVPLKPEDYCFLSQLKQQQVINAFPDVKVQFCDSDSTVCLEGSVRSVKAFKQALPGYYSHDSVPVQLHPLIVQYLPTINGRQQLNKFVDRQQCQLATYFDQTSLQTLLLCDQPHIEAAKTAAVSLQAATLVKIHPLTESFMTLLPDLKDFDQFCQNLEMQNCIKIVISTIDQQLSVVGFTEDVTMCYQTIVNFIREKCTVDKPIELEKGVWRLFCGPMHTKWGTIVKQCHQCNIELAVPDKDIANPVIKLKGESLPVQKICNDIATLEQSVAKSSIPLSRPGASKYFQEQDQARIMLAGIEAEHRVCIEFGETATADDVETTADTEDLGFVQVCVARTNELFKIAIYVGDISEFTKAEVIVNAANGDLKHKGGVAKAISDKGGPVIQQESTKYVRAKGSLWEGETWITTKVGKLQCKALIHAVGPVWTGRKVTGVHLLSQVCTKSLQDAQRYQSIAFPAISAGIFKFPIDICADTLMKTVVDFSKNNPALHLHLREINFVLRTDSDAQEFQKALQNHLPPQNMFQKNTPTITTTPTPTSYVMVPPAITSSGATADTQSKKKNKKKRTALSLSDTIKLNRGSLLDVTADVYVNTTNTKLNLSSGAVSQMLLKSGGPDLQAECDKYAPISVGDMAITGGGKLECRYIFHVVIPRYDGPGGQAEKVLKNSIIKCMKECTKRGVISIAFPAIGTGNLGFPNNVVARIMIGEISSYLSTKTTSLREVNLIIYMADTYEAFTKEVASHDDSPKSDDVTMVGDSMPNQTYSTPFFPITGTPSWSQVTPSDTQTAQTYVFGELKVQVVQGDIAEDNSDAVVNTTNKRMQLVGSGIAGALARKAGPMLQHYCNSLTSQGIFLDEGKVIPTHSGSLNCKSVFHVCIEDPKKLVSTIEACLQKAEECKYASIAFPALGTGLHYIPTEVLAKEMMKAIQQFMSSSPYYLACIRIVLFKPDMHKAFIKAFNPDVSQSGWFQRARHYIGSLWSPSNNDTMKTTPEGRTDKELELTIFGETEQSVHKAEEMLDKIIAVQFIEDKIDDPNIENLQQSDIQMLEKIAEQMEVVMRVFPPPLSIIRLKGNSAEVLQMKYRIQQSLSARVEQVGKRREAEQLQKVTQWKRLNPIPQIFDADTNFEIEYTFTSGRTRYVHELFTIDFDKMEGTDHGTKQTFKVDRVDLEKQLQEGEKPDTWEPMPVDQATNSERQVYLADLQTGSAEYNNVLKEFQKTMIQGTNYNNIVQIQRIQNPALYAQYIAKKKAMDKHMRGKQNEQLLFHGTAVDSCPKINATNFNRSFAGQNATVYGQGCYFARDASYSARGAYSKPDANGNKYMYLVRVLTGEYTVGNSSMKVPPPKDPSKDANIFFDSTVDKCDNPSIFVVFFDWQAYPEYLITFN